MASFIQYANEVFLVSRAIPKLVKLRNRFDDLRSFNITHALDITTHLSRVTALVRTT